jgi:hypothetical protein
MPATPGRLSTATVWPRPSLIFCAIVRATKSDEPPAV